MKTVRKQTVPMSKFLPAPGFSGTDFFEATGGVQDSY